MTSGLFTEIIKELKEKASTIPGKLMSSFSTIGEFLKKFTTEPFNYAVLQTIIYITLLVVIILRDPYDLRASRPLEVTMGMLFLFFLMFVTYFFIDHRKQHNLSNEKGLWTIFFKKLFSLVVFPLIIIALILLGLYIIKRVPQITNITAFIFRVLAISGVVAIGYILYKKYSKSNVPDKKNRFLKLLQDIILYLPCLLIDFVEFIKKQWNLTTKTEWLILGGEIVLIGLAFVLPVVYQKLVTHDGVVLVDKPRYLSSKYELGTYQNLTPADNTGQPFKYSYSISGWFNVLAWHRTPLCKTIHRYYKLF